MAVYETKQARPAPSTLNGPIYWLRENLFATLFDTILTFVILAFLFWTIPPFLNWSIFDASFIGQTKADALGSGANWIFIKEKFGK